MGLVRTRWNSYGVEVDDVSKHVFLPCSVVRPADNYHSRSKSLLGIS